MKVCNDCFEIPIELYGEDVYDMFYLFDNENEAVDYVVKEFNLGKNSFLLELHEEDSLRDEFGKKNYLRSATVSLSLHLTLTELMDGKYILWKGF